MMCSRVLGIGICRIASSTSLLKANALCNLRTRTFPSIVPKQPTSKHNIHQRHHRLLLSTSIAPENNNVDNKNNTKSEKKSYKLNKMASSVKQMESYLPKSLHSFGYTFLFNRMVKLAGTAGLVVKAMSNNNVEVFLKNQRKIQNHIGGLHACSMALAAESATGIVVGMNIRDTHIPLIKSMHVDFVRRCEGSVTAKAWISEEDLVRINEDDRGDVTVQCIVKDESDNEPIQVQMIWAWVAKNRKKK